MLQNLTPEERDALIARVRARLAAERDQRNAFKASPVFTKMVLGMMAPGPRIVHQHEGEAGYLEQVRKLPGWHGVSLEAVGMFIRIVGDSSVHNGDTDKIVFDPAYSFPVSYFESHGLVVMVAIGQGSSISIMNKEYARKEKCPLYEPADTESVN